MPPKLKKIPKALNHEEQAAREIHLEYFRSIGAYYPRDLIPNSPAWRANFHVKFGKPAYRREAWLRVREELAAELPRSVFMALDEHFQGPATPFVRGFSYEERERLSRKLRRASRPAGEID